MSIRTIAAPIAAILGALALPAPAASASHAAVYCRYNAVSQATATGRDTWVGHAHGYVAGDTGEPVAIRCVIRVDGAIRAATGWGTGSTVAVTADQVTYVRALTEVTLMCAEYVTADGPGETCFQTTTTQIPPKAELDAVAAAVPWPTG